MDRARQVRIIYRDSYLTSLGRFMKNRYIIVGVAILLVGTSLFVLSLGQATLVRSKFVQQDTLHLSPGANATYYFSEPAYIDSNITFYVPSSQHANYKLIGVDNYTKNSVAMKHTFSVSSGKIANSSVVKLGMTYNPQGQEYELIMSPSGNTPVDVTATVVAYVYLANESNKNLGVPGAILILAGLLLLSGSVSTVYTRMKGI